MTGKCERQIYEKLRYIRNENIHPIKLKIHAHTIE